MTTAIDVTERALIGEPLRPVERAVAGIVLLSGAVGHAALVAAAVIPFYVLLYGL